MSFSEIEQIRYYNDRDWLRYAVSNLLYLLHIRLKMRSAKEVFEYMKVDDYIRRVKG